MFAATTYLVQLVWFVPMVASMLLGAAAFEWCNHLDPFTRWGFQTLAMAWEFGSLGLGCSLCWSYQAARRQERERRERMKRGQARL